MFGYEPEFVDCGDARIACYDIGRGRPLVLLHGNGEDSSYWKAQIPEFTRFYRVIAVDSRGHGASESGTQGLSFALMAEDLKKVLDARGVKKAHILGFSDGGNLAIKFALTYPDYVDKLILNGANVEMFNGIKPHFQLPIYAAISLVWLSRTISRSPTMISVGMVSCARSSSVTPYWRTIRPNTSRRRAAFLLTCAAAARKP